MYKDCYKKTGEGDEGQQKGYWKLVKTLTKDGDVNKGLINREVQLSRNIVV